MPNPLDKSAEIHEALAGSPLTHAFAEIERKARDADETHNGWKNYPTWAVNLWLSNDEPLYRQALERTADAVENPTTTSEYWNDEETARFNVADMLKDWVTDELAPDFGASFASDLLGYALGEVDWHEIADAWIEMVSEEANV